MCYLGVISMVHEGKWREEDNDAGEEELGWKRGCKGLYEGSGGIEDGGEGRSGLMMGAGVVRGSEEDMW